MADSSNESYLSLTGDLYGKMWEQVHGWEMLNTSLDTLKHLNYITIKGRVDAVQWGECLSESVWNVQRRQMIWLMNCFPFHFIWVMHQCSVQNLEYSQDMLCPKATYNTSSAQNLEYSQHMLCPRSRIFTTPVLSKILNIHETYSVQNLEYSQHRFCPKSRIFTTQVLSKILNIHNTGSVQNLEYSQDMLCPKSRIFTTQVLYKILNIHKTCSVQNLEYSQDKLCPKFKYSWENLYQKSRIISRHALSKVNCNVKVWESS